MDLIVSLAKRRGFVFPSSEIYGGMAGFWDYGPLGVELKRNIEAAWWRHMVTVREDVVGLEAAIIMNPRVWVASGHVGGFSDPLVDHERLRTLGVLSIFAPRYGGSQIDIQDWTVRP